MEKQEKTEKKEKNEEKAGDKEKTEKTVFIVLGIAALIILVCIIAVIVRYNSNHVTYAGIEFNKNYMGNIIFYTAKVPVVDIYGKIKGYQEIDFRNDPRNLKEILVNATGDIKFVQENLAYVSYGEMKSCSDNILAATNLGLFLSATNIKYKGAVDDPAYINNTKTPYVNCQTNPSSTVILIKGGNETKIEQTNKNCYELVFKDCEILKVTEKFELTVLEQYMGGITKK